MSWPIPTRDFRAAFSNGVASPARFQVWLNLPPGVIDTTGFANVTSQAGTIQAQQMTMNNGRGKVNIMCSQATFPQRTLLTSDVYQNSASFRVPYSLEYDPVQFAFYADGNLNTRSYFEIWQTTAANIMNNTMNYPSEFVSDVVVAQLNHAGAYTYFCTLVEAWPITIGSMDLSMSSSSTVQQVTVTMAYKYWTSSNDSNPENTSASRYSSLQPAPSQNTPSGQ